MDQKDVSSRSSRYMVIQVSDGEFRVCTRVWHMMQQSALPGLVNGKSPILENGLVDRIDQYTIRLHVTRDVASLIVDALNSLRQVTLQRNMSRVVALTYVPIVPDHLMHSFWQTAHLLGIVPFLKHDPCRGCSKQHPHVPLSMICPCQQL